MTLQLPNDPSGPLAYERQPRRPTSGQFGGLFVTVGALNLLVFGFFLIGDLYVAGWLWTSGSPGRVAGAVVQNALAVACGVGVVVGSVGSFSRATWARTAIQLGAGGTAVLVLASLCINAAQLLNGPTGLYNLPTRIFWLAVVVIFGRLAAGVVVWLLYRGMHADFYFKPSAIAQRTELFQRVVAVRPEPSRFRIRGRNAQTGESIELNSRATTEEAAIKFAIAFGVAADSIVVEEIAAESQPPTATTGAAEST